MTDEELKNKCKERAKIFQQAMESCKSSSPMDCIEWFADRIAELEKENAELKCECRRCVYTDSPCVLSDYGKDKNGICEHFKDVFEELQDWKKEWQEQVQKATDEGYARTLQTMQLSKAKEIIKNLLILKNDHYGNTKMEWRVEVTEQAEQFLKESK